MISVFLDEQYIDLGVIMKTIKKWFSVFFVVWICAFISCHETPLETEPYPYAWSVSTPEEQGFDAGLVSDAVYEAGEMAFIVSLLVIRNDYLVTEEYFYPELFGKDYAWMLRSATKSFMSTLIGLAIEAGFIDSIGHKILDYFPEYVTPTMDPRKQDITIEHLLTMTSGLPGDEEADAYLVNDENFIQEILKLPLHDDPGKTFAYSGVGVHLLSGIITKATGMSALAFAERYLFQPLQISVQKWEKDLQGYNYGYAGMYMTPRDMARYGYLYLNEGNVEGTQILSEEWIEDTFQYSSGGDRSTGGVDELGYGYLWWLGKVGDYRIQYALGFAGQYIILFPGLNMIVVATSSFPESYEEAGEQITSIMVFAKDYILPAIVE